MLTIESYMKKPLVTAEPGETVKAVARRMAEAGVGAVLLLDDGSLAGLFSERDLLRRVVAEGRDPAATRVGEVATSEVATVGAGTALRACAEELKARGVRHLPVVESGRPIGIVSARDFFEAVAGELEHLIERVRYDEQLREGIDPYDHLGGSYGR